MSDGDTRAVGAASTAYQILIAGTIVFLDAFYRLTSSPIRSTFESQVLAATYSTLIGVKIIALYVAFVAIIIGHALLGSRNAGL